MLFTPIWPDGQFTVRSFQRCLEDIRVKEFYNEDNIWQRICPSKVEIFTWHLIKGRIMDKKVMHRFGFDPSQSLNCKLCNEVPYVIGHLFLHYPWTWELWYSCMLWWDVKDSNSAEIKVIHKVCELCVSNEALIDRDISVIFNRCASNFFVDMLVKNGSSSNGDITVWGDS
ncbi:hypothetical protein Dsin_018723 [Dipteronia sinensis]|uniref:Reverse transcriptase zinc-binding domain-containing protein n=1 Tax=Dipteronia sinensis TaxID=43782 RepID=A0AAE0A5U8_9ROSI|nr:hypothetical protein Dsin_018723 [Dipteronia sinensis]